jgi:hypothetical protein
MLARQSELWSRRQRPLVNQNFLWKATGIRAVTGQQRLRLKAQVVWPHLGHTGLFVGTMHNIFD